MKKALLLTGFAMTMAFSSCMKDEVREVNQGTAIGFRTSVETRGYEVKDIRSLPTFNVTAYTDDAYTDDESDNCFFENLLFQSGGGEVNYTSDPVYYWPKGKKLSFYAYAPVISAMGNGAIVSINKTEQKITGFTVKGNIDEQHDLVYAVNAGDENEGIEECASIPLVFKHMLSKISIGTENTNPYDMYEYIFAGARIGGVNMTGDVDLASAGWTNLSNKGKSERTDVTNPINGFSYYYVLGNLSLPYGNYTRENFAFVIPQEVTPWDPINDKENAEEGAYISLYVQINKRDNGVRVFPAEGDYGWVSVPIPDIEWEAGYAYHYTLNFANGAGYIDPESGNNAGESVLGEIKITMEMDEMKDGVSGDDVINEDMIGKWSAYSYKEYEYEWEQNENGVWSKTDEHIIEYTTPEDIASNTNYFSEITIVDGRTLKTMKPDQSGTLRQFETPYTTNRLPNGSIEMYIDVYKDNDGSYAMVPIIENIIPVTGQTHIAESKVIPWRRTDGNGNIYRELVLMYKIFPLDSEVENQ